MTGDRGEDMRLLTVKQAAAWFHVSVPTIYRLLRSGAIKGAKVGGQWRIPLSELRRLIEEQIKI